MDILPGLLKELKEYFFPLLFFLLILFVFMYITHPEYNIVNAEKNIFSLCDYNGDEFVIVQNIVQNTSSAIEVSISVCFDDGLLKVGNGNREPIGVRVFRDSSSVILSDGFVKGRSSSSAEFLVEYDVEYTLFIRLYDFDLDWITDTHIGDMFGKEDGWLEINPTFIRKDLTYTLIFRQSEGFNLYSYFK